MLYFDHNATHPLSVTAREAWLDAVARFPANASSPHRPGQRAERALENARERLARILGCVAQEIVFTSGATESANMVLAAHDFAEASPFEHPCVLEPLRSRSAKAASNHHADAGGKILRVMMAANNETGVLMPWREALAESRERGAVYFCDAAQWVGKLPAAGLGGCDFVAGCAHKFGGPAGVGFLKCPADMPALIRGGPQEEGRRAGTENVAGVLAMVSALEEREAGMATVDERRAWRAAFEEKLLRTVPEARIVGADADRLWNTLSVIMPDTGDCRRRWVVVMDSLGFAVSTGSACASGKEKPSHVLTAMGFSAEEAGRALRFSAGWETREEDWERLLSGVIEAVRVMRS